MNKLNKLIKQLADFWGCDKSEFDGMTVRELLNDADHSGEVVVYWGCWTTDELDSTI